MDRSSEDKWPVTGLSSMRCLEKGESWVYGTLVDKSLVLWDEHTVIIMYDEMVIYIIDSVQGVLYDGNHNMQMQ